MKTQQKALGLELQSDYYIVESDYREFLDGLDQGSVDLILTDPPYCISRETRFHQGGAYGKREKKIYMDFGDWDHSEIDLQALAEKSFRALRAGGTAIIFYDTWKIERLRSEMESVGFGMFRLISWEKVNPVPLNADKLYLTNTRELAVVCVKGKKPTFNTKHHKGTFYFPIPAQNRVHPTQKPLRLFQELIKIHSNSGDLVVDCFLGGGTTAYAALSHNRKFAGCDADRQYIDLVMDRLEM